MLYFKSVSKILKIMGQLMQDHLFLFFEVLCLYENKHDVFLLKVLPKSRLHQFYHSFQKAFKYKYDLIYLVMLTAFWFR